MCKKEEESVKFDKNTFGDDAIIACTDCTVVCSKKADIFFSFTSRIK